MVEYCCFMHYKYLDQIALDYKSKKHDNGVPCQSHAMCNSVSEVLRPRIHAS